MFIDSLTLNMDKNVTGQLTFEMMIAGEAGLNGKTLTLQFLVKITTATTRCLFAET